MTETVGFIGLGQMGGPMAMNLAKAGRRLRKYNRSPDKAAPLLEHGALLCRTPAGVAKAATSW
jgi:3-hydroxyisobutyrate dehydrogenase